MQEPPWLPRTEDEYRQQLAEDAGPQPDEMARLQQALDASEQETKRLHQALCDIQFDLINCSQAAGSGACEHLKDAIRIVIEALA